VTHLLCRGRHGVTNERAAFVTVRRVLKGAKSKSRHRTETTATRYFVEPRLTDRQIDEILTVYLHEQ
jgi:hypothetical protein